MDSERLFALIESLYPAALRRTQTDRPAITVAVSDLLTVLRLLRDHPDLKFDLLLTHTAVDYPSESRIELLYLLYSTAHGFWLVVAANLGRTVPVAPSVCTIWPIAEWQEREVYDLMGVLYADHPDLRRVFLEDDWVGYPLRKDYVDPYMLELPK